MGGEIAIDDRGDMPYKINLDDGTSDWFHEQQVEPIQQTAQPPEEAASAQVIMPTETLPTQLQEPLLQINPQQSQPPDVTGDNGARWQMSRTLRMLFFGLAMG